MKKMNRLNHILVIEDNDDHAEILSFYLQEKLPALEIQRIRDGKSAMDFFRSGSTERSNPSLVFLDLNLPFYSGHEVLKVIKSSDTCREIPVVIFTTSAALSDRQEAFRSFANSYITKPTDPQEFDRVVELILDYWNQNSLPEGMDAG